MIASAPLALSLLAIAPATAAERPAAAAATAAEPDVDEADVKAALERLREDGMLAEDAPGARAENAAPTGLAKNFGGRLLSEAFSSGADWSLNEVLSSLGLGSDAQFAEALGQLGQSMAALQADVNRIMQLMHEVLHGQDRSNFYNSYTQAGLASSRIDTAMRSVADWVEHDITPSEKNVSDMALVINVSMGELDFTTTNAMTGTIPLMMKAADSATVTDFDWDYWEQIDEVRESYRSAYAQGLAGMDMLTEWDHDGTVAVTRDRLVEDAVAATLKSYAAGVELDATPPTGEPAVQARGTDYLVSDIGPNSGNGWERKIGLPRNVLEPILRGMAQDYDPAKHGGVTLEKYLEDRGIPTTYIIQDSFHKHVWRSSNGSLTRWDGWELRANAAEIRGNGYSERTMKITKKDRAIRQSWSPWNGWTTDKQTKADAEDWWKLQWNHWRSQARNQTSTWLDRHGGHGQLLLKEVKNNNAGWAADFNSKRVEKHAFPDA